MSFLDFIFDNLFIVIIIVFGLVNFFNSFIKKNSQEQRSDSTNPPQQERQRRATSAQESQPKRHVLGRMAEQIEQRVEELTNQFENYDSNETVKKTQESLKAAQQKQYDELRNEIKDQSSTHKMGEHKAFQKPVNKHSSLVDHHEEEQFDIRNKLTKKGLIEGVIMAEVLGPPRAHKPYQSIIHQRRRS